MMPKYLNVVFILIFSILFTVPLIQGIRPIVDEPQLGGVANSAQMPSVSFAAVKSGEYFQKYADWCGENFGFRKTFVRLENQLNYSLFKQFPNMYKGTIIIGEDNWLFIRSEIIAGTRNNNLNVEHFRLTLSRLKKLQDYMDTLKIPCLLVIAPDKVSIYPNKVPAKYFEVSTPSDKSLYGCALPLLDEYNIRYFDGYKAAIALMQEQPDFPVFSPDGTHWTFAFAAHCLEKISQQLNPLMETPLPDFSLNYDRKGVPYATERDLRDVTNVMHSRYDEQLMIYPTLTLEKKDTELPKIAIVGDSFSWTLINNLLGDFGGEALIKNIDMYYYFNSYHRFPAAPGDPVDLATFSISEDMLANNDALLIVLHGNALFDIGFGFLEKVFESGDPFVKTN